MLPVDHPKRTSEAYYILLLTSQSNMDSTINGVTQHCNDVQHDSDINCACSVYNDTIMITMINY